MSTPDRTPDRLTAPTGPVQAAFGKRSLPHPASRGRLVLSDGVVEKIAGQVVTEIGAAYGTSGGFLGIGAKADRSARPKVDVDLTAESADLSISVGIAYPTSIRRATQEIRESVTVRLAQLTGVQVGRVDIDVAFLSVQQAGSTGAAPRRANQDHHQDQHQDHQEQGQEKLR